MKASNLPEFVISLYISSALLSTCAENSFSGSNSKHEVKSTIDGVPKPTSTDVPVPAQPTADPLVFGDGTTTAEILNACASKTKIKKKIHIDFAEDNTVCQWDKMEIYRVWVERSQLQKSNTKVLVSMKQQQSVE